MRYDGARLAGLPDTPEKTRRARFDGPFFVLSMLLLSVGVVMVLSASYPRAWYDPGHVTGGNAAYYFVRQLVFAVLGIIAMLAASRVTMAVYRRTAFAFLLFTLVLLMLVQLLWVLVEQLCMQ
jgi:cell division protein FtsW